MRRLILILLFLAGIAHAGDTLLTRSYYLYEDTYIQNPGLGPDNIHGAEDSLLCGNKASVSRRMILATDNALGSALSDINDSLDNADSMVYCSLFFQIKQVTSIQDADSCQVNPLLVAYEEDYANWTNRASGTAWNTAGCGGSGTDYDANFLFCQKVADTATGKWYHIDVTEYFDSVVTGNVAYWYGFRVIHTDERRNRYAAYYSTDMTPFASYSYHYPYIKISYWTQTAAEESGAVDDRHGQPDRHGAWKP